MIKIKTNIAVVKSSLLTKLAGVQDIKQFLRPVTFDVMAMMQQRIHGDGKAADGSQIGTYSRGYMAIRTGAFSNSDRNKKGKDKGKNKNAGTISRGSNAGASRPQYHRSGDTKVIVSLTRQLENDWAVMATPRGWGIGFNNPFNAQKMRWVEEAKDKKIAALTTEEKEFAINKVKSLIQEKLDS